MPSYPDGIFSFEWQDNATTPLSATNLNTTSDEITRIEQALGTHLVPNWTGSGPVYPLSSRVKVNANGHLLLAETGGNVGVGTSSPATRFQAAGSANAGGTISWTGGPNGFLGTASTSPFNSLGTAYLASTSQLAFSVNQAAGVGMNPTSVAMLINNSGYVGIGTPNPTTRLQAAGSANTGGIISITGGPGGFLGTPNSTVFNNLGTVYLASTSQLGFSINQSGGVINDPTSVVLLINNSGNVGIGTASPGAKLDVAGSVKLGVGIGSGLGFYGATPISRPSVTGDKQDQTALVLGNLLTALANLGLITDSTN